jgi:hypothetical protein
MECKCGKVVAAAAPQTVGVEEQKGVAAKLDTHEEWAPAAIMYLISWLRDDPSALLAMARGRHAEGHYRYGDTVMYAYDQRTLVAEAAQELADGINYIALMLRREAE